MHRRDLLRSASMAALGLAFFPCRGAFAKEKKQKVLYFTRSATYEHSAVRRKGKKLSISERVLKEVGKRHGFDVVCTKDGRVFDGDLDQFDAFAFYTSGDLTKPKKGEAPPMTLKGKDRLLAAVAGGKGFLGIHSCSDSFHSKGPANENQKEVDPFLAMLGGEFIVHGKQQVAKLRVTSPNFPGVAGQGLPETFELMEEWYTLKNFAPDLHVILVQETAGMEGDCYQRPPFPASWARLHDKGRVVYTSLGHRHEVWEDPKYQEGLAGALAWSMGNVDFAVPANIKEVAPKADQLPKK
ncbi:MAG: ThuA domain-containing protein [Pirellulales bacterium]|nr:ThuA domain-containing protein [Pirellulales bacterium]